MAKILFIVNEHPTEAFAIPVAKEVAKGLRQGGCEVILKKTKLDETNLGKALRGKIKQKVRWNEFINLNSAINVKLAENIYDLIKEHRPDVVYCFHCGPLGAVSRGKTPGPQL